MLSNISKENLEEEKSYFIHLIKNIDSFNHTIFNAGAGAGKTYALVEAIRYVLNTKHKELEKKGQKIACITYTNVAANEIKTRLGRSDLVSVSTIHDWLWNIIKNYPNELNNEHKKKLAEEILKITSVLESLDIIMKESEETRDNILNNLQENKKEYYKIRGLTANEFRTKINELTSNSIPTKMLGNISKFKIWVSGEWKKRSYKDCLEKLNKGQIKTHAVYDSINNNDHLEHMKFSHDTLLEYGKNMVKEYPRLAQLITDTYPYFFIDEYQDTDKLVIELIAALINNATNIKHYFWSGFFGDYIQNIYEKGVGEDIFRILEENNIFTDSINKPFNRRSTQNIITIGNKIRKDKNTKQKSIYSDSLGDDPQFFYLKDCISTTKENETDYFLNYIKTAQNITQDNKLHVFVLKNESLAKAIHIDNIWSYFNKFKYYDYNSGHSLGTELLSNDINKLGIIQKKLYDIIAFIKNIYDSSTFISDIFDSRTTATLTFTDMAESIKICKSFRKDSLLETITTIDDFLKTKETNNIIESIKNNLFIKFSCKNESIHNIISNEMIDLLYSREDNESLSAIDDINAFLSLPLNDFIIWSNHIDRNETKELIYHTYHGTKGLEFDNVLIIMDAQFNKNKNFFPSYFQEYQTTVIQKTKAARNLLYVAVTRAKKHLTILYRDSIDSIKPILKEIFGNCQPFTEFNEVNQNTDDSFINEQK